jgi:hypothetical protein
MRAIDWKFKVFLVVFLAATLFCTVPVYGWSNGGYSANTAQPDYGTHDWIAQHALDYLPSNEKQYLTDNLAAYLYGTELPDNNQASDHIGDTAKHHIYYSASGTVTDDASAQRAKTEYNSALSYLKAQNYVTAAKTAGIMTHYIADMAVFGHVMGSPTPWGTEVHHSDYEDYVNTRTNSYTDTFNSYLSFDGTLTTLSAYNAAVNLAFDTTSGGANQLSCTWMDTNYNWNTPTFAGRCGQSLNLAVNAVADVLHTLYQESGTVPSPTPTSTSTSEPTPTPTATATTSPSTNPTPTPTTTNTPNPTNSPTPFSSLDPTATIPEYPTTQILTATMLVLLIATLIFKKCAPIQK